MDWRSLLTNPNETIVAPWCGGRSLQTGGRSFHITGPLPKEEGWFQFQISGGREARVVGPAEPNTASLKYSYKGFLVGNYLIRDDVAVSTDPAVIAKTGMEVHLIDPGLDRFVKIEAGEQAFGNGPLVFISQLMPEGAEEDVLSAFLDKKKNLNHIKNVPPALDAAFRLETWRRAEAEKRRLELERKQREEEERLAAEERKRALLKQMGTGEGRREMAKVDFEQAARAALATGNAEYLDHRKAARANEMVVRFRLNTQRFECVCHATTLRIIDAGICLTAHYDDENFDGGTKGDTWLTLESLPSVIREAIRERRLVVWRHAN